MAIAFAGTAPFGEAILRGLVAGRDDVVLVLSQPDRPAGRGRGLRSPAVAEAARELGIELVQPDRAHDPQVLERLTALGVTTIVVAAFGQMIREPLLSDYLMLNVHGSLLPHYRGAAPVERSIMDGNIRTGVGIMQMEAGLDTGPVALEGVVPIGPNDTGGEIFSALQTSGVTLLLEALAMHDAGHLKFTPQDDQHATYAHKITADDRALDPLTMDAQTLHNYVRALCPHIGAWIGIDGARATVWKTAIGSDAGLAQELEPGAIMVESGRLYFGSASGIVEIVELQPSGKKRMDAGAWVRGLREVPTQVAAP